MTGDKIVTRWKINGNENNFFSLIHIFLQYLHSKSGK